MRKGLAVLLETLCKVGYSHDLLEEGHDGGASWITAYARQPRTARNACVAAIEAQDQNVAARVVRLTGVPVALLIKGDRVTVWQVSPTGVRELDSLAIGDLAVGPSEQMRALLDPRSIHRAKTMGRYDGSYQLNFVDIGLLAHIERSQGETLQRLLERIVTELRPAQAALTTEQGHQVLTIAFWILAARMLRDHGVPGFADLTADGRAILEAVARHYSGSMPMLAASRKWRTRVDSAARLAWEFGSRFGKFEPEAIGYVYESSLIADKTRRDLGTHSTPPFLVEYVLGRLREHILALPPDRRVVVEPACGHGAFLVGALRVLAEDMPDDENRHEYLRSHLRGVEIDHAAMEMARLSLTIADVPNSDGWNLRETDMFQAGVLEQLARGGTVLLSNPPFQDFSAQERQHVANTIGAPVTSNKAAEMLRRVLPALEPDAVVGIVVPRQFLNSAGDSAVRRVFLERYQLLEICLLPDKIFRIADHECAVLLARGSANGTCRDSHVLIRRVRESGVERFKTCAEVSTEDRVLGAVFRDCEESNLLVPELRRLWTSRSWQTLGDIAFVQQGMSYHGWVRKSGHETVRDHSFERSALGVAPPGRSHNIPITDTLPYIFMDTDPEHISRPRGGLPTHAPQVVLNTHPHARGPWRLMAYIEPHGVAVPSTRISVRPRTSSVTVELLWALCNSLIANAFVFSHLGKRDITTGELTRMPVPAFTAGQRGELTRLVSAYFKASRSRVRDEKRLDQLLYHIDAVLLSAYGFFAAAEQQIMGLFEGYRRPGLLIDQCSVGRNSRLPQYLTASGLRPMLPPRAELGHFSSLADLDAEIDDGRRELAALRRAVATGDERLVSRMKYVRDVLERLELVAAERWQPSPRNSDG